MILLAQKLANRARVIAYLEVMDQRAKDAIVDEMTDDQWIAASQAWGDARRNLITAKTGKGWEPFLADAIANGF